jgi:hypothetical protein
MNSFNQFKLGPKTSERLWIQTVRGQYAPKFLPEGVGPASFILQQAVNEIYRDFDEWMIVIFDNLLILANDYNDAHSKIEKFYDRCIDWNVFLNFSKTWLWFKEVNFLGYECKENSYQLSSQRKEEIDKIPFPNSIKQMQSFLDVANFFSPFVPRYADYTAPLHDTFRKDFVWNPSTWTNKLPRILQRL